MLHVTFRKLHEALACKERYKVLAHKLGGITKYGRDTPITMSYILDEMGLDDALWSLRATIEAAETEKRLFACDCAERVLPIFEAAYPGDTRPRTAIQAARRFALGEATREELDAARAAAWAAGDAARDAAWAARDAAWAAGDAGWDAARAAGDAARAAARAARDAAWAARDAAWAARDAAWAAERDWQEAHFREVFCREE